MQAFRCAAYKNQDADRVGDPDVLTDKMDASIPKEGDYNRHYHDDTDRSLDWESAEADRRQAFSAGHRGEDAKYANLDDYDQAKEDIGIFSKYAIVSVFVLSVEGRGQRTRIRIETAPIAAFPATGRE